MAKTGIVELLEAGLKAEALRQRAIANNVANLQTPGYRRLDVRFEQLLAKAIESGEELDLEELEAELYQPKNTAVNPNGNDVNLEGEVGDYQEQYSAKGVCASAEQKYSQIDQAINNR